MSTTDAVRHLGADELEAGLDRIRRAPREVGRVELVVRRPAEGERELLAVGELDEAEGLVGDRWVWGKRGRPPSPLAQVTIMAARVADLVGGGLRERWALAGDQLYVDLDLGEAHLPARTLLRVGTATLELTAPPHTGCKKFVERFGLDAMLFVNTHPELRLRGANARVAAGGVVRPGDEIRRLR